MRKKQPKAIYYNPINAPRHGYRHVRWVENVSCGLRLVGFADEIARKNGSPRSIDHKGWYTHDDGDTGEVMRGIVYQLPARNGQPQYVYGYADPINDDCALLNFEIEVEVMNAARAADLFAEGCAEDERDYRRAWDAGRRYDDLAEEIKSMREEALKICGEMREARRTGFSAPTICYALRARVGTLYRNIQEARKKRAELLDTFGSCEGFKE